MSNCIKRFISNDFNRGMLLSVLFISGFNLVWLVSYFPITEGWFSAYAQRWYHGYLPYRDTALFLPPLYTFQLLIWSKIFGISFFTLRIIGLLALIALTVVIYCIYIRLARNIVASLATIVSILCFESFNVFIPYDYHTFVALYSATSLLCIIKSYENHNENYLKSYFWITGSGIFASLCLLTKHSTGIILLFSVILILLVFCLQVNSRNKINLIILWALGYLLPLSLFCIWLFFYSSAEGFYDSVILGVSAKGSLFSILFGFLKLQMNRGFIFLLFSYSALFLIIQMFAKRKCSLRVLKFDLWIILSITLSFILVHHFFESIRFSEILSLIFEKFTFNVVPLSIIATAYLFIQSIPMRNKINASAFTRFSVASLSCCFMYSTAMSTLISAPGAFVGLGAAIIVLLDKTKTTIIAMSILICVFFLYIDSVVSSKYQRPYYWWNISSNSIYEKSVGFTDDKLKGLFTNEENKLAIEDVVDIVSDKTKPNDYIFTYPSIPLFYLLTNRWPPTYSLQHWYDTVSDATVRKDLISLKANIPKVFILLDLPDEAINVHESLFRGGRLSAQREMLAWIREKTNPERKIYSFLRQYDLGSGATLKVWAMRDGSL